MRAADVSPDVFTWTTLMEAYVDLLDVPGAREVMGEMRAAGVRADEVTWNTLLNNRSNVAGVRAAMELMRATGLQADKFTWATLLKAYLEFPELSGSRSAHLMEEMRAVGALEDEENGSLTSLGIARKALDSVRAKDPEIESVFGNLTDAFFLLGDANSTLNSYLSLLEADPDRLSALQERKAALNFWVKKYAIVEMDLDALIVRGESSKSAMADLTGGDELIAELEKELVGVKKSLLTNANDKYRNANEVTFFIIRSNGSINFSIMS
jgi:pentatricopeptide repeat protein